MKTTTPKTRQNFILLLLYRHDGKEGKNMTKYATSKRNMNDLIKDYRSIGYNLITYGNTLAELEKDCKEYTDQVVIVLKKGAKK